jgi:hypothetical protein
MKVALNDIIKPKPAKSYPLEWDDGSRREVVHRFEPAKQRVWTAARLVSATGMTERQAEHRKTDFQ